MYEERGTREAEIRYYGTVQLYKNTIDLFIRWTEGFRMRNLGIISLEGEQILELPMPQK